MKILLITTRKNLNPGDQFIRIGIERMIREICSDAEFIRVSKEDEEIGVPKPFDRAILCGMPLWWDNPVSKCQEIGWWGPIFRGWVSEDPRKFLVLGAGSVTGNHDFDSVRFLAAVEETISRSFAVVTRNQVIDHPKIISSICPAAFAADWREQRDDTALCNLMPDGAHDSHLFPEEAALWRSTIFQRADALRKSGFTFIAHSPDEKALALELGWPESDIRFFDTPEEYIDLYSRCRMYVGNRLHPAVVVGATGGLASVVGYDSRLEMVKPFTPRVFKPSDLGKTIDFPWYYRACDSVRWMVAREKARQQEILLKFLS